MLNSQTGQALANWQFQRGRNAITVKTSGRVLVTEVGTLVRACLDGIGIARIKAIGIQELLDQGKLVELLPSWLGEVFPLYALFPSRHLPPAKVHAFIDFVHEAITTPSPKRMG